MLLLLLFRGRQTVMRFLTIVQHCIYKSTFSKTYFVLLFIGVNGPVIKLNGNYVIC